MKLAKLRYRCTEGDHGFEVRTRNVLNAGGSLAGLPEAPGLTFSSGVGFGETYTRQPFVRVRRRPSVQSLRTATTCFNEAPAGWPELGQMPDGLSRTEHLEPARALAAVIGLPFLSRPDSAGPVAVGRASGTAFLRRIASSGVQHASVKVITMNMPAPVADASDFKLRILDQDTSSTARLDPVQRTCSSKSITVGNANSTCNAAEPVI